MSEGCKHGSSLLNRSDIVENHGTLRYIVSEPLPLWLAN